MSWSFSVGPVKVEEFDTAIDEARAKANMSYNPDGIGQADAAVKAAKLLVASGCVGQAGCYVSGNLSGHANPGHAPAAGMSLDTTYVSIYQSTPLIG